MNPIARFYVWFFDATAVLLQLLVTLPVFLVCVLWYAFVATIKGVTFEK